jgi:Cu/Ag efflux protein CusF
MTRKMIHLGSVLIVAALLAALAPAARAQALQPCSIAAIDARTGVVSAKVNASGAAFQFRVTDAALLKSLKVGQEVYANFTTKQVSLDGKRILGEIISPPQGAAPLAGPITTPRIAPPAAKPAPGAPATAAPLPPPASAPVGKPAPVTPAAVAPITAPKTTPPPPASAPVGKPAPATPAAAAPVTAPKIAPAAAPLAAGAIQNRLAPAAPSCTISAINTTTGVVTATEIATAKIFQFKVSDAALLNSLKIGRGVYANFGAGQVSMDGITSSGTILSAAAASAAISGTGVGAAVLSSGTVRDEKKEPASTKVIARSKDLEGKEQRYREQRDSLTTSAPSNNSNGPVLPPPPPPPAAAPAAAPSTTAPVLAGAIIPAVYLHGSVSLAQARVLGGSNVSGTVTLNGQPTGEPVVIALKSSDPAATVVPSQISVPAGEMTSQFTVNTTPVAADPDSPEGIPVSIAASTATGGALAPANLRVMTPTLTGLGFSEGGQPVAKGLLVFASEKGCTGTPQLKVVGRYPITACVKLNGPAPKGGITIPVANDYANLLGTNFPASVTIPEGLGSAAFAFSTATVSTPTPVHISASRSPRNYLDATLTLEPPPTLTSVYFDPSSVSFHSYQDPIAYGIYACNCFDYNIDAYLTFSSPPDTSQGDPGTADLCIPISFPYPNSVTAKLDGQDAYSQGSPCPSPVPVSVAGSSSVTVRVSLEIFGTDAPLSATLNATYRGTTLSSETYTFSHQ